MAQSLLDALAPSFPLCEGDIYISASIGIVISDVAHHERPEHLLRDAPMPGHVTLPKPHGKNWLSAVQSGHAADLCPSFAD